MGINKKYLLIAGVQVSLDDPKNEAMIRKHLGDKTTDIILKNVNGSNELAKQTKSVQVSDLGFGAVVMYKSGKVERAGKVTGFNKNTNKFIVSKSIGASSNGFLFSGSETEEVDFGKITQRLP